MFKILKLIFAVFLILVIGGVLYLGYLGFVPGVSGLFGSNKPRDLGVAYTEADFNNYLEKSKSEIKEVASLGVGETITFSGKTKVDDSFTQEECTGRINFAKWKYMPVKNSQVKFDDNGVLEYSGQINSSVLSDFASAIGYSSEEVQKALSALDWLKANPPIYFKGTAGVKNNQISVETQTLQIGRLNIPIENYNINEEIEKVTEQIFSKVPGFYAESIEITKDGLYFNGTSPTEIKVVAE